MPEGSRFFKRWYLPVKAQLISYTKNERIITDSSWEIGFLQVAYFLKEKHISLFGRFLDRFSHPRSSSSSFKSNSSNQAYCCCCGCWSLDRLLVLFLSYGRYFSFLSESMVMSKVCDFNKLPLFGRNVSSLVEVFRGLDGV